MNKLALHAIRLYRILSFYFPGQCKFYPSCSHYAEEAFKKYSFTKALFLSLKRVIGCNWFSKGGIDPLL